MSKLPSAASLQGATMMAKIPDGSISLVVRLQKVIKPMPAQNGSGNMTPAGLSVIVCEDVKIPYVFVKPKAKSGQVVKNLIDKPIPEESIPDVVLKQGQTHFISMFKPNVTLTLGSLYTLEGVFLDAYMGDRKSKLGIVTKMEVPSFTVKAMRISSPPDSITNELFDKKIPFDMHKIVVDRDIPGEDRLLKYNTDREVVPYYTVMIDIIPTLDDFEKVSEDDEKKKMLDKPGTLVGSFMKPKQGMKPALQYEPFNVVKGGRDPMVCAITGGTDGTDVAYAQLFIQQNEMDGTQLVFKCFTRVKEDAGLNKFQLDWNKMGHILGPKMYGKAYCTINRIRTKELEVDDDENVSGVLAMNVTVDPNMAMMAKHFGYRISWDSCVMFDARLKKPEALVSDEPQVRLIDATALNILKYTGNCELLPIAEKNGWVEFYVMTNMPIADKERKDEIDQMNEQQLVLELKNKKYYGNIDQCIGIFVIPTSSCECKLYELVSVKGRPPAALLFEKEDVKRVKTE